MNFVAANLAISIIWFLFSFILVCFYFYHTTPLRSFKKFAHYWLMTLTRKSKNVFIRFLRNSVLPKVEIFAWSAFSMFGYYALLLAVFYLFWFGYGYSANAFESTIIHHPRMIVMVLLSILVPGILIELFWMRVVVFGTEYKLWKSDWHKLIVHMEGNLKTHLNIPCSLSCKYFFIGFLRIILFAYDPIRHNPVLNYIEKLRKNAKKMAYASNEALNEETGLTPHQSMVTIQTLSQSFLAQPFYYDHEQFLSEIFVFQIQIYSFIFMIFYMFCLLCCASTFSSLVIFLPREYVYIDSYMWNLRFRCLILLWLGIPSAVGKLFNITRRLSRMQYHPVFIKSISNTPQQ